MPHATVTGRVTLQSAKGTLYYFLADTAAMMAERPLQEDDTYALEIVFVGEKVTLIIREVATTTVVGMKIFTREDT